MSRFKDFEGKSLDDAISEACEYYGVAREKLEIEIVSDAKTGIFGLVGVKKAWIRAARVQPPERVPAAEMEEAENILANTKPGYTEAAEAKLKAEAEAAIAAERRKAQEAEQALAAEQARQREAQAAEQRRLDAIAAEEARRQADQEHRGAVMRAAKEALMEHGGIGEGTAKKLVLAIVAGTIPAVTLKF